MGEADGKLEACTQEEKGMRKLDEPVNYLSIFLFNCRVTKKLLSHLLLQTFFGLFRQLISKIHVCSMWCFSFATLLYEMYRDLINSAIIALCLYIYSLKLQPEGNPFIIVVCTVLLSICNCHINAIAIESTLCMKHRPQGLNFN